MSCMTEEDLKNLLRKQNIFAVTYDTIMTGIDGITTLVKG